MEIVFLGTGSMMPTMERAQTALVMSYWEEHMLFDCGEGTQRQLRIAGISQAKITKIFLTHWHGDHFFGLPGLLENMAKHKEQKEIHLYGPRGTKLYVKKLVDAFFIKNKITIFTHEISKNGVVVDDPRYTITATYVKHSIPCVAYAFQEKPKRKINMDYLQSQGISPGPLIKPLQEGKPITFRGKKISVNKATHLEHGKKVALILDTKMDTACIKIAQDADLLICEATFHSGLQDKATDYYHLSAKEAALIARKAKAKKLVLTHFSQRYTDIKELEQEAKEEFSNTVMAADFLKLIV